MQNWAIKMCVLGALASALSGCAGVVGGGLVASSVIDRRSGGSQADDEIMEQRIKSKAQAILRKHSIQGFQPHISVVSYNRRILLLGQVSSDNDSQNRRTNCAFRTQRGRRVQLHYGCATQSHFDECQQ